MGREGENRVGNLFSSYALTTEELGLERSSKSPKSVASDKNAAVVSNDALSKGEEREEIPVRLKGL